MINKDELLYKIDVIIEYLKESNVHEYKLYNRVCPDNDIEPDSTIIEYAEDVKNMVIEILKIFRKWRNLTFKNFEKIRNYGIIKFLQKIVKQSSKNRYLKLNTKNTYFSFILQWFMQNLLPTQFRRTIILVKYFCF